jgi:hypothetical protein
MMTMRRIDYPIEPMDVANMNECGVATMIANPARPALPEDMPPAIPG